MNITSEHLGKTLLTRDGRRGVFLGCMENDDELVLRAHGELFFVWVEEIIGIEKD